MTVRTDQMKTLSQRNSHIYKKKNLRGVNKLGESFRTGRCIKNKERKKKQRIKNKIFFNKNS